jgi:hypothetical protein
LRSCGDAPASSTFTQTMQRDEVSMIRPVVVLILSVVVLFKVVEG